MNPTSNPRYGDWMEDVVNVVHDRMHECRRKVDFAVGDRPLETVAVAFVVGWAAGRIGLTRVVSSAARVIVPLAPYLLTAAGTAALWGQWRMALNLGAPPC